MNNRKKTVSILIMVVSVLLIATPVQGQAPWYDEGWSRRKSVSITGVSGAGTDYQVILYVTYDSDMQTDFDDLLFTKLDGVTLLDHWTESYSVSAWAYVWVEVTASLESDQTIFMYYGNSTVANASNGTATFLFYEDWATETVIAAKWDTITSDGSATFDDTDADYGSILKIEANTGTDVFELRTTATTTAPTSIIGRLKIESTVAASQRTVWGMGSMSAYPLVLVRSIDGSEDLIAGDDDLNIDSTGLFGSNFDQYVNFMITRSGTEARLYADFAPVVGAILSCEPDTIANVVTTLYVRDSEYDLYCDWVAQRKFIPNGPASGSFGDEEAYFDAQFAIDGWLILVGLVMIPTSTLYLAYGVKHDRSSDRLFYGLVIFLLGCGLFIGGIIP